MTKKRIEKTAPLLGNSLPEKARNSSIGAERVVSQIGFLEKQAFDPDGEMLIPALATTLGIAYLEGWFGIEKDPNKGVSLLIRAALQGEPTACFKLATLKTPNASEWEDLVKESAEMLRVLRQEMEQESQDCARIEKLKECFDIAVSREKEIYRIRPPYYLMDADDRAEYLEKARNSGCNGPWQKKIGETKDVPDSLWIDSRSEYDFDQEYYEKEKDEELPWEWADSEELRKLADLGDRGALRELAVRLLRGGETEKGELILKDLADSDSAAQYRLAEHYRRTGRPFLSLMRSSATSAKPYPDALYEYAKWLADPCHEEFAPHLAIEYVERFLALFRESRPWTSSKLEHLLIELQLTYCNLKDYAASELLDKCLVLRTSSSLLYAGLMQLRGIGCSANVPAAVSTFELAGKFAVGLDFDEEEAASITRFLCKLNNASDWHKCARRLVKTYLASERLLLVQVSDIEQLFSYAESRIENQGHFDILRKLKASEVTYSEKAKTRATPLAMAVQKIRSTPCEDHKNFVLGMVYVLSSRETIRREVLLQYWHDDASVAERFMLAALMEKQGEYEEAQVAFHDVKDMLEIRKQSATDNSYNPDEFEVYLDKETDSFLKTLDPVVAKLREQKAAEEAKREMLSFLSHTLTNSLTGTTNTLLRIARSLNEPDNTTPSKFRRSPAERLIGLVANVSFTERLLENFKLYASDPTALKTAWIQDQQGGMPVVRVLALSLRQSLLRFLFAFEHGSDFARLMPNVDRNVFIAKFLDEAMACDLETDTGTDEFILWAQNNLPCFDLSLDLQQQSHISPSGPRFIVLFSIIGELFGNALKFSDGRQPIRLVINETQNGLNVRCTNTCDANSTASVRGGQRGISFMTTICGLVGATLDVSASGEIHEVRAWLPHS